jgi:RNA polymerase sigma factor (sigma-70 family)
MTLVSDERARWLARHILPHEAALRAWLWNKVSPGVDVDDVVQETYAILAARADIDGVRNPKAYAYQVAHSVILQHVRRSQFVPIRAVADLGALDAVVEDPSPEQAVLDRQELGRVHQVIDAMPRQTRQAFVLRRVEGLSQKEIARRMKLSERTVEKHIARGVKLLSAVFGRGGNDARDASRLEKGLVRRDPPKTNRQVRR